MPIQIRIRILPQFIHKLENQNFSVIGVLIFSISGSILKLSLPLLGMDTDPDPALDPDPASDLVPDRQAIPVDADPDPVKLCRSDQIRVHNTG